MSLAPGDRVLLCLGWGIGDVVLQSPALPALRAAIGGGRLVCAGGLPAVSLVERAPWVDEVVSWPELGIREWGDEGGPGVRTRVRRWLRERRFDAVLNPLSAAPAFRDVAWTAEGVRCLAADRATVAAALRDGASAGPALLAGARDGWGVPLDPWAGPVLPVEPGAEERAQAERLLDGGGGVAIAPFASTPLKRWPAERFAAVARALASDGVEVRVLAAPDDASADEVGALLDRIARIRVLPVLDLHTLGAVLERVDAVVANDTGVTHLAGALGVAVVAVFGPTDAHLYRPRVAGRDAGHEGGAPASTLPCPHRQRARMAPPECWARGRCLLERRSCIDTVGVEEVLSAARAALDAGPLRGADRAAERT